jgi:hypothetical protein
MARSTRVLKVKEISKGCKKLEIFDLVEGLSLLVCEVPGSGRILFLGRSLIFLKTFLIYGGIRIIWKLIKLLSFIFLEFFMILLYT